MKNVKNFIKGKIAEVIFEEMFREAKGYTVIPFGYEKIVPELARFQNPSAKKVVDNIRTAPDYALIMRDGKSIFLVEVKFQSKFNIDEIIRTAKKQMKRWDPSWLFVATLEGFYFGECSRIVYYEGIKKLGIDKISENIQKKYLKFVKEFER